MQLREADSGGQEVRRRDEKEVSADNNNRKEENKAWTLLSMLVALMGEVDCFRTASTSTNLHSSLQSIWGSLKTEATYFRILPRFRNAILTN